MLNHQAQFINVTSHHQNGSGLADASMAVTQGGDLIRIGYFLDILGYYRASLILKSRGRSGVEQIEKKGRRFGKVLFLGHLNSCFGFKLNSRELNLERFHQSGEVNLLF